MLTRLCMVPYPSHPICTQFIYMTSFLNRKIASFALKIAIKVTSLKCQLFISLVYVSEVIGILNFSNINFVKHNLIAFHFLLHKKFGLLILQFLQPVATSQNEVAKEGKKSQLLR